MSSDSPMGMLLKVNGRLLSPSALKARIDAQARALAQSVLLANKEASIKLYQWVLRNFQSEGGNVGGWAPLSPATVAWKAARGYKMILQNTGLLRGSFMPYADEKTALIGSPVPYSEKHQLGDGVPQRRQLPTEEEAGELVFPIYGRRVSVAASQKW